MSTMSGGVQYKCEISVTHTNASFEFCKQPWLPSKVVPMWHKNSRRYSPREGRVFISSSGDPYRGTAQFINAAAAAGGLPDYDTVTFNTTFSKKSSKNVEFAKKIWKFSIVGLNLSAAKQKQTKLLATAEVDLSPFAQSSYSVKGLGPRSIQGSLAELRGFDNMPDDMSSFSKHMTITLKPKSEKVMSVTCDVDIICTFIQTMDGDSDCGTSDVTGGTADQLSLADFDHLLGDSSPQNINTDSKSKRSLSISTEHERQSESKKSGFPRRLNAISSSFRMSKSGAKKRATPRTASLSPMRERDESSQDSSQLPQSESVQRRQTAPLQPIFSSGLSSSASSSTATMKSDDKPSAGAPDPAESASRDGEPEQSNVQTQQANGHQTDTLRNPPPEEQKEPPSISVARVEKGTEVCGSLPMETASEIPIPVASTLPPPRRPSRNRSPAPPPPAAAAATTPAPPISEEASEVASAADQSTNPSRTDCITEPRTEETSGQPLPSEPTLPASTEPETSSPQELQLETPAVVQPPSGSECEEAPRSNPFLSDSHVDEKPFSDESLQPCAAGAEDEHPQVDMERVSEVLRWAGRVTDGYPRVTVIDTTASFDNGIALCAILHRFNPELVGNFNWLLEENESDSTRYFHLVRYVLGTLGLSEEWGSPWEVVERLFAHYQNQPVPQAQLEEFSEDWDELETALTHEHRINQTLLQRRTLTLPPADPHPRHPDESHANVEHIKTALNKGISSARMKLHQFGSKIRISSSVADSQEESPMTPLEDLLAHAPSAEPRSAPTDRSALRASSGSNGPEAAGTTNNLFTSEEEMRESVMRNWRTLVDKERQLVKQEIQQVDTQLQQLRLAISEGESEEDLMVWSARLAKLTNEKSELVDRIDHLDTIEEDLDLQGKCDLVQHQLRLLAQDPPPDNSPEQTAAEEARLVQHYCQLMDERNSIVEKIHNRRHHASWDSQLIEQLLQGRPPGAAHAPGGHGGDEKCRVM